MSSDLKSLKIDRDQRRATEASPWAVRWILVGVGLFVVLGIARFGYTKLTASTPVDVVRVTTSGGPGGGGQQAVALNATGYIVAHHKIEVAAKVIGKVAWIGVEKGDKVSAGQVLVRLEDEEYRAQLEQAKGNLAALEARLQEAMNGSRPEEIAVAQANLNQAKADVDNARVTLDRTKNLSSQGVTSRQALDDAQAKYDSAVARERSLERTLELAKLGPRREQVDALRGQVAQAKGAVDYAQTQVENTVIKAPSAGTVLERNVEKGEFVTTGFVGDKGAKGYVVSLADLNDLQVELDIAQNDFARLHTNQKGTVSVDAFPDLKYEGEIYEMSPEANRQKATVQVKVKVMNPDGHLRPEMNASVAFLSDEKPSGGAPAASVITIPAGAIRGDAVFVILGGKAVKRPIKAGVTTPQGVQVSQGLIGGEDLIVNPPADLKEGDRVQKKG